MKIKITDFSRFQIDNATYFSRENTNNELEVFAIFGKRRKEVLLFVRNNVLDFFKLKPKYMIVIDESINESWVHVKKYRYDGRTNIDNPEFVTLKLDDLYAPQWMVADDFLYNVIMNKNRALEVFLEEDNSL
jgi:hypothetical protein